MARILVVAIRQPRISETAGDGDNIGDDFSKWHRNQMVFDTQLLVPLTTVVVIIGRIPGDGYGLPMIRLGVSWDSAITKH